MEDHSLTESVVENEEDSDLFSDDGSADSIQKGERLDGRVRSPTLTSPIDASITGDDKSAIIQDWLFSENVPYFSSNELIKTWALFEFDQRVFFKMITCPIDIPMHRQGVLKYEKNKGRLNIKHKLTFKGKVPFKYNPDKHNVYYFRSRKMLYTLMLQSNTAHLQAGCPHFIKIFCNLDANPRRLRDRGSLQPQQVGSRHEPHGAANPVLFPNRPGAVVHALSELAHSLRFSSAHRLSHGARDADISTYARRSVL